LIDLDRFAAKSPYHLLLVPPFVLEDSHIGEITDKLATTFDTVMPPASPKPDLPEKAQPMTASFSGFVAQ
jgi:hypothetical protein